MKKILYIALSVFAIWSCTEFDDSRIWKELNDHENRIKTLEDICRKRNEDIKALQSILNALQNNDYVTGVSPIMEGGEVVGYTIKFTRGEAVSIYHGMNGADGSNGSDGSNGTNGQDGKDGHTPVVGIVKDTDGVYYWTLDGEWILDDSGNKIPADGKDGVDGADGKDGQNGSNGKDGEDGEDGAPGQDGEDGKNGEDGKDGEDGEDGEDGKDGEDGEDGKDGEDGSDGKDGVDGKGGKDGVTPILRIEDEYWYVSYDNGQIWEQLYKATAADGQDGDSFFVGIDTADPDFVIITLASDQQIKLPTWKAFQELQTKVNQLNTNISALQKIIEALQDKDYITDIAPIIENGKEKGYTIYFAKSLPVTIYHGTDGKDGQNGADGKDGQDGEDGAPGQDGEDGKDGQDGAPGKDGEDGENGAPGKDGEDGKDGNVPVIGIRQDNDGNYYWTINGEWMLDAPDIHFPSGGDSYWVIDGEWLVDENGNKIPASGMDGKDGVTPKLKIEAGWWYVSFDGGRTWESEPLGPATDPSQSDIFSDVTFNQDYLYLHFANGQTIQVPRYAETNPLSYSIMDLKTTFQSATFTGNITAAEEDLIYSRVTVYYSDAEDFNIHNASSASTQAFDYNGNFSLTIYGLDCSKKYKYCFFIESASSEAYGSVMELELGYNVELGYKTGEYAKTGYYSSSTTSSIINGYAVPVLKSHMPEKIEGLEFYIKGSTERTQPLIAYIGYMTDPTKASTLTKIKSCTTNVMITKSYSKVMLHLDVSRMELSAVPEDGEFYVGFYPPLKYADIPLGIGHTAKTDSGYIETEGFKGIYSYVTISNGKYTWGVPSSKQPRYVGLLVSGN